MKKLTAILILASLAIAVKAQTIVKSVNEKISGKAAAGNWIDYSVDPATGDISFTFETKKTKSKAKYETYSFGSNLAYNGMTESELELEKAKKKFKLLKNKPKATKLLRVGKNLLTGQMKMELGTISYWYAGRALISRFDTDKKVKPKGDDGSKLLLVHSRTEDPFAAGTTSSSFFGQTRQNVKLTTTTTNLFPISYNVGDVLAVVYEKSGRIFQDYAFLVYNAKDLTRKLTKKITLDHAYRPVYVRDMPNGDIGLIFAPITEVDVAKTGRYSEIAFSDKPNFKYLRINTKGETIADVNFELPKNKIGIPYMLSLIPATDPEDLSVYLTGYGNPDFLGMGTKEMAASFAAPNGNTLPRMTNMTGKKLNTLVLGKFQNNKLAYLKTMNPTAFWKKGVAASSDVSMPTEKDAGKFFLGHIVFQFAGEINGKNYLTATNATTGHIFTIETGTSGDIEKVYTDQRKKVEFQEAILFPKASGEIVVLYTHQPKAKEASERSELNYERSIEASVIKPGGNMSTAKSLLPKKHFVDLVDPIKALGNGEVLILGHSSKKDLTLSHVKW
ncbi:MAG: hypothetical protein AB8F95_17530 [Bacteroidia bacterium]